MEKRTIVIVGADKGGVGKTTLARALLDYFRANQIGTRAFDAESPRGTLKRFHPEGTSVVDLGVVADQMAMFDTFNSSDAAVTIIDVRAGLLSPTLRSLRDIGLLELAKSGDVTLVLFHVLGPSIASLDEINETAAYLGDARHFIVKNFINNAHFFKWDEATSSLYFKKIKDPAEIAIPTLNAMATEQLDLLSLPYLTFIANKKPSGEPAAYSFVLRGYVRNWLAKVWAEFDRIGLLEIVTAAAKTPAAPKRVASA